MKLFKAMATVAGLTGLSRVAGFVRDMLTAGVLGAGPMADAFFVALKIPNFFRRITAEGAFGISFVPLYSETLTKDGEAQAACFANEAFSLMLWILSAFTALALLAMPAVILLIAPGFNSDPLRFDVAVELTRITFPYLLLISLTSLLGAVMNAHDRFAPFAVAPVLFNLCLIGAIFLEGFFADAGQAMAWGICVSGFLQLGLLYVCARRIGYRVRLVKPQLTPRIRRLFKLMVPGIIGAGVVHINLFADLIMASFLPVGSISYLYYADRLNQLPLSMVGIAVGTALLPMLSKALAAGDMTEARTLYNRALEVTLFFGIPAAVGLFLAAEPIINVLFRHGAFDQGDAAVTAMVLRCYSIGLPAYVAVKVLATAFWSRQDTITPVKISIVTALTNIVLAVILMQFMGVTGIALATGIVAWLQIVLYQLYLKGHEAAVYDERFRRTAPCIVASAGAMAAVVFVIDYALAGFAAGGSLHEAAALLAIIGGGGLTYAAGVVFTGVIKPREWFNYIRKKQA